MYKRDFAGFRVIVDGYRHMAYPAATRITTRKEQQVACRDLIALYFFPLPILGRRRRIQIITELTEHI